MLIDENAAADLNQVLPVLRSADAVVLACHVNPDGDALGSMLGFYHAWVGSGRSAIASFSEPFVTARHYRDLPGLDLIVRPAAVPEAPPVMVTFDCGSVGRLGDLEVNAKAAGELVVFDHHQSNQRYGSVNLILPEAPATAAVVVKVLDALGIPLNRDAAFALYVALVCDTGRFQYDTTTVETFQLAERLVAFDLPIAELGRHLFDEHRFTYLQLLGHVLSNAHLNERLGLVWAAIPDSLQQQYAVNFEELEGAIDSVRSAAEAEVACVLKEDGPGTWRGSLRSVSAVDVSKIAAMFGGGGHRFAAGFVTTDAPEVTIKRIESYLQQQ